MTAPAKKIETQIPPGVADVLLTISVRVGTAKTTLGDLMNISENELIVLNSRIDQPVEICVEDKVIALGHLIKADDGEGLAVKVTDFTGERS